MDSLVRGEYDLFPNGLSGIFFNFGSQGKLILEKDYLTPPVSLFGQIDQCFTAVHNPGFYSLGVLFKPTTLSKFLRVDLSEFTNKAIDGTLLRSDLYLLHTQLQDANTIQDKVNLLNEYFSRVLLNLPLKKTITDHALDLINTESKLSIEKLATHLNISPRYLEKTFKQSVGLSPKVYSMIVRFKRMERQMANGVPAAWGQMDFVQEYYDQTHFIKEFKRFTGHTPSEYLMSNFSMGSSYLLR